VEPGEKGGKEHEMPAHHEIEQTIDEYLSKVSIDDKQPLFQSVDKAGTALSGRALNRYNAWAAIGTAWEKGERLAKVVAASPNLIGSGWLAAPPKSAWSARRTAT
jgi:hypothetical protein